MAIGSFRQVFVQAGNSCWQCYIHSEPHEKEQREKNCAFANTSLSQIINSCKKESKDQEMANQAQARCRGCDYGSPRIKDYLESEGIKVS